MDASQLAMLMDVCAKFGVGDRELFGAVAAGVKEHWTKLSTPEALTVIHAFSSAGHYDRALFDDLADSIAYCNHFFSATLTDPLLLSRGFAAYAKAGHERADLLIQLSRGILDENIDKLPSAERREAVMNILRCFDHFNFWPEVTQHLLVLTKLRAADFTPQDMTDVQAMVAKVQDLFGPLTYYDGGYKNPSKHFHDHAKHPAANYQMHVFRDELMPKAYSPASVRPMRD